MACCEETVRGGLGLPLGTPKQLTARNTCTNCMPERCGREAWAAWYQLMTLIEWLSSEMLGHSRGVRCPRNA